MSDPRLLVWLLAAVLLATPAGAQNRATTSEITGLLEDATGGVLPGAAVTVVNLDNGLVRTAVSDGAGVYHVLLLPPGRYDVRAELAGFGAAAIDDVTLTVGASRTINFTLALAGVAEQVTVTAATSAVETTTDTSDVTLDSQAIANLPINGRRFHDFIKLTPTAQVEPQRGQISLAGQRGINGNISIDGADYNQPFFGGIRGGERSQFTFTIPQEAIREFRVVKAGYSPEFGRSTGGLVNAVTKSGANDTSGTAFYLLRPEQLAARNAFGQDAAPTQHQFGGSLGGALARDRAFYFVAYEQQEFRAPREVRFARLDGFTPTAASREGYDHYRRLETPFEVTNDARAWLARVDVNLPRGNRFNVRYNGSTNRALNSDGVGGVIIPTTHRSLETNGTEETRRRRWWASSPACRRPTWSSSCGRTRARTGRARPTRSSRSSICRSGSSAPAASARTTQYDWRAQAGGNVTWLAGGHSVKAGFDYNHVFIDQTFGFLPERRLPRLRVGRRDHARHHRRRRRHSEPLRLAVAALRAADRQPEGVVRHRRGGPVRAGRVAGGAQPDGQLRPALGRAVQPHPGRRQRRPAGPTARRALPHRAHGRSGRPSRAAAGARTAGRLRLGPDRRGQDRGARVRRTSTTPARPCCSWPARSRTSACRPAT